jgi:hypothetical protein
MADAFILVIQPLQAKSALWAVVLVSARFAGAS